MGNTYNYEKNTRLTKLDDGDTVNVIGTLVVSGEIGNNVTIKSILPSQSGKTKLQPGSDRVITSGNGIGAYYYGVSQPTAIVDLIADAGNNLTVTSDQNIIVRGCAADATLTAKTSIDANLVGPDSVLHAGTNIFIGEILGRRSRLEAEGEVVVRGLIGDGCTILGNDIKLSAGTRIGNEVTIGNMSQPQGKVSIGHGCKIPDNCRIAAEDIFIGRGTKISHADLNGRIHIDGRLVSIDELRALSDAVAKMPPELVQAMQDLHNSKVHVIFDKSNSGQATSQQQADVLLTADLALNQKMFQVANRMGLDVTEVPASNATVPSMHVEGHAVDKLITFFSAEIPSGPDSQGGTSGKGGPSRQGPRGQG